MQSNVRIERRDRIGDDGKHYPFSEIFITHNDQVYCTRLFYPLDDSPHARAAQFQDFLRRQRQEMVPGSFADARALRQIATTITDHRDP